MGLADLPPATLLTTCGGAAVKIFDVTADSGGGDPLVLNYSPSPGSQVNAVKWNHTNLVVASVGEDKKISLWHRKGHSIGVLPDPTIDSGDDIKETIVSINFSNKGSRYLCSGGTANIVRIWDLQRKRCIKWLSGHTDTITGVMYNCKDEHLASISVKGDLILHNLTSGARVAELKDPNRQVLRVLDYSRFSRHVLVTAGDDGSVHLWDTNAKATKISWMKQHSAPTTGLCLSPSSDKIIASVGLDKKLYMFDSGTRRHTYCVPYEEPFSSLAYSDDGNTLTAGTNGGRVLFFDVRGKPQAFTILRAYNSSEAVMSLCWQRSKPVIVNQTNCSDEIALLGGSTTTEESVLMPDPLPSVSTSLPSAAPTLTGIRSSIKSSTGDDTTTTTSHRKALSKLNAPRGSYSINSNNNNNTNNMVKDDMDVFSPLVDVQPFTQSISKYWDESEEGKRDYKTLDKKSMEFSSSSSSRRFHLREESNGSDSPLSLDWRSISNPRQDEPSLTSRQIPSLSRFGSGSGPTSVSQDATATTSTSTTFSSRTSSLINPITTTNSMNTSVSASPVRYTSYAERLGVATSAFNEGLASAIGSPKLKKTGAESREELLNNVLSRQEVGPTTTVSSGPGPTALLPSNGVAHQALNAQVTNQEEGASSSFSIQLVQRMLEETLGSVQSSIREDVRNVHIELLRQFHMHEMEMSSTLSMVLEKQEMLMKEVQLLRKENQELRNLL